MVDDIASFKMLTPQEFSKTLANFSEEICGSDHNGNRIAVPEDHELPGILDGANPSPSHFMAKSLPPDQALNTLDRAPQNSAFCGGAGAGSSFMAHLMQGVLPCQG